MNSMTIVLPDFDAETTAAAVAPADHSVDARVLALVLPAIRQFAARSVQRLQWTVLEPGPRAELARRYGPARPRATEAAVSAWMLARSSESLKAAVSDFNGPLAQLYDQRSPLECLALAVALEARAMRLIRRVEAAGEPIDARSRAIIEDFTARNGRPGATAGSLLRRIAPSGLLGRARVALLMRPLNRRLRACFPG